MSKDEEYEVEEARILLKAEKNLGRQLTPAEIRKVIGIPHPRYIDHPEYGKIPRHENKNKINHKTGKLLSDEDVNKSR